MDPLALRPCVLPVDGLSCEQRAGPREAWAFITRSAARSTLSDGRSRTLDLDLILDLVWSAAFAHLRAHLLSSPLALVRAFPRPGSAPLAVTRVRSSLSFIFALLCCAVLRFLLLHCMRAALGSAQQRRARAWGTVSVGCGRPYPRPSAPLHLECRFDVASASRLPRCFCTAPALFAHSRLFPKVISPISDSRSSFLVLLRLCLCSCSCLCVACGCSLLTMPLRRLLLVYGPRQFAALFPKIAPQAGAQVLFAQCRASATKPSARASLSPPAPARCPPCFAYGRVACAKRKGSGEK